MMFSAYDTESPKTNFRRISRSAASRSSCQRLSPTRVIPGDSAIRWIGEPGCRNEPTPRTTDAGGPGCVRDTLDGVVPGNRLQGRFTNLCRSAMRVLRLLLLLLLLQLTEIFPGRRGHLSTSVESHRNVTDPDAPQLFPRRFGRQPLRPGYVRLHLDHVLNLRDRSAHRCVVRLLDRLPRPPAGLTPSPS